MVLCAAADACSIPHVDLSTAMAKSRPRIGIIRVSCCGGSFPSFLPKEVEKIKDPFAVSLARRIERIPVKVTFSDTPIMSSCVRPSRHESTNPIVLLHGHPSCNAASKRVHLYQFWKSYIKRPMILVGSSLGSAVAIDFAVNHPEAVSKIILIDASVYAEGTSNMGKLPRIFSYAGVALLKSVPLRLYANYLALNDIYYGTYADGMNVGRLHCFLPWWEDATVDFMISGGYDVANLINQVRQKVLIIWGEDDKIINFKLAVRLHSELRDAKLRLIPECGHIPHVEKPRAVADMIVEFAETGSY
ncbi:Alpha/beta hydrolase domain-containing protein [Drosera capensis]